MSPEISVQWNCTYENCSLLKRPRTMNTIVVLARLGDDISLSDMDCSKANTVKTKVRYLWQGGESHYKNSVIITWRCGKGGDVHLLLEWPLRLRFYSEQMIVNITKIAKTDLLTTACVCQSPGLVECAFHPGAKWDICLTQFKSRAWQHLLASDQLQLRNLCMLWHSGCNLQASSGKGESKCQRTRGAHRHHWIWHNHKRSHAATV